MKGKLSVYEEYLKTKKENTDGSALWFQVPKSVIDSVICATIGEDTINNIFSKVDALRGSKCISDNMLCLDSAAFKNKWKERLMGKPAENRIPELQGKLENVNVKRKRNWFQYLTDRFSASLFADDSL